jgi:hypothetical protein
LASVCASDGKLSKQLAVLELRLLQLRLHLHHLGQRFLYSGIAVFLQALMDRKRSNTPDEIGVQQINQT